jgi:hypothetical protein
MRAVKEWACRPTSKYPLPGPAKERSIFEDAMVDPHTLSLLYRYTSLFQWPPRSFRDNTIKGDGTILNMKAYRIKTSNCPFRVME